MCLVRGSRASNTRYPCGKRLGNFVPRQRATAKRWLNRIPAGLIHAISRASRSRQEGIQRNHGHCCSGRVVWGRVRCLCQRAGLHPCIPRVHELGGSPLPCYRLLICSDRFKGPLLLFLFPKRQGFPHLSLPLSCRLRRQIYRCNLRNNRPPPAFQLTSIPTFNSLVDSFSSRGERPSVTKTL